MTLALLLAALPALYWPQPPSSAPDLLRAGIRQVLVPPAELASWQGTGVEARPLAAAELAGRVVLRAPGPRPGPVDVASASRRPWLDANGWRILRRPGERYAYQLPSGRAALAAAEAFSYGADAVLTIDPADLDALGRMLAFLSTVAPLDLPPVVDVAMVDDGSFRTGEVLNLMARRNLLFAAVRRPPPGTPLVVRIGSREFPDQDAADPDAFALLVRRRLGDQRRTLRLYGSEVVLAQLTGDARRRRLQLLNYGGIWTEGVRVRLLGNWTVGRALVAGRGAQAVEEAGQRDGATEFSLPWLESYAVVDLQAAAE